MSEPTGSSGSESPAPPGAPELVDLAIGRLESMQLGDGSFRQPATPGSERADDRHSTRQTAIVLLGLLRAEGYGIEHPFHTGGLRGRLLGDAGRARLGAGNLGLILWAESRLEAAASAELIELLAEALGVDGPGGTRGSELAWILTALAETGARGKLGPQGRGLAGEARNEVLARRREETGLFQGPGHGPGRRFQSFEGQIQTVAALSKLNHLEGDEESGAAAVEAARALLDLQRADGSWPAVIDVRRGAAVEAYPLTSVNQLALAPMGFAAAAEISGEDTYLEAALRGMEWAWGRNELGEPMLDPEHGTLCRAITRRVTVDRARLVARAATSMIKPLTRQEARRALVVDRTSSPADLGWVLEAWAEARSRGSLYG